MADTLSWGKPKVEVCAYVNGVMPVTPVWTSLANIKEDSANLSSAIGTRQEAKLEGGDLLAVRAAKSTYTFKLELYATKGATKPIPDVDGIVGSSYAVRLTPEDPTQEGFIIDKAFVEVEEDFTTKDGMTWKYTFTALAPATGSMLKPYMAVV